MPSTLFAASASRAQLPASKRPATHWLGVDVSGCVPLNPRERCGDKNSIVLEAEMELD